MCKSARASIPDPRSYDGIKEDGKQRHRYTLKTRSRYIHRPQPRLHLQLSASTPSANCLPLMISLFLFLWLYNFPFSETALTIRHSSAPSNNHACTLQRVPRLWRNALASGPDTRLRQLRRHTALTSCHGRSLGPGGRADRRAAPSLLGHRRYVRQRCTPGPSGGGP